MVARPSLVQRQLAAGGWLCYRAAGYEALWGPRASASPLVGGPRGIPGLMPIHLWADPPPRVTGYRVQGAPKLVSAH